MPTATVQGYDIIGDVHECGTQPEALLAALESHSRTPPVAALYGARLRGIGTDEALADVLTVLPDANPESGVSVGVAAVDATGIHLPELRPCARADAVTNVRLLPPLSAGFTSRELHIRSAP
ncbi:hypothetical protein [Mycolicibacterium wolinskyi]|uniref:hypothetical protein n=1 Tax=Mycolicibacterium wolinskyi TaxID=59750 RepID=UPI0039176B2A